MKALMRQFIIAPLRARFTRLSRYREGRSPLFVASACASMDSHLTQAQVREWRSSDQPHRQRQLYVLIAALVPVHERFQAERHIAHLLVAAVPQLMRYVI
jgi:hypothetical protein